MRFLRVVLGWILVFAAVLGAVLWYVDPRGQFGVGRFPTVTLDARRQKMTLFRAFQAQAPVQGLILGSSRTMKLDPEVFSEKTGLRFFNFTVDAAKAEDYLAIYRWAKARGAPIRRVMLGLDVEALHNDNVYFTNFRHNAELRRMLAQGQGNAALLGVSADVSRVKDMFTVDYLRDTARVVAARARSEARVPFMQFTANGYLHYPGREQQRAAGTFDLTREVSACLPGYLSIYGGMRSLSPQRWGYLEALVREVQQDGGQVEIWISPLHPATTQLLASQTRYTRLLAETRAALQDLGRRTGVTVRDYASPERFGSNAQDWYDCAHIDNRGAALLAGRLLGGKNGAGPAVNTGSGPSGGTGVGGREGAE
ncbi:SGNH/GDSL hydrolase family protein [Deinococcus planocerae]|uniref:SGNH/GDSL hydrolase family protein n=1 Tax=Deinococcus planocerae TaxID=1737569 RepID=UPI000C7F0BBA|nr:SGNH/GDSL hydrolase family protein [Deinococcus planocerae]